MLVRSLSFAVALALLSACAQVDARVAAPGGDQAAPTASVAPGTARRRVPLPRPHSGSPAGSSSPSPSSTSPPTSSPSPSTPPTVAVLGNTATVPPAASVPVAPRIAVVGDSLTEMSAEQQRGALMVDGWDVVAIDGAPGAPISDRLLAIRSLIATGRLEALVIALGTNDARRIVDSGVDPAEGWRITQASAFTALADARAVPCVVWVGVNANAPRFHLDEWGAWFNGWLPRYTIYADWTTASKGQAAWFLADGVHLTDLGGARYAELIATTVRTRCASAPSRTRGASVGP